MKELGKCVEQVPNRDTWGWAHCGAKAKAVRDGKPYCGRHDPVKVAERRAKRDEKYKAHQTMLDKEWAGEEERERRAGCFDGMLEALDAVRAYYGDGCWCTNGGGHGKPPCMVCIMDKAIAKAKGKS